MGALSWWHWLIVALVVVVIFGSKRLPDAARGLGQSLRILKSEVKEMQKDDSPQPESPQPTSRELPPSAPNGTTGTTEENVKKSA
ncbi:Sec-independent protein translocase subunit TatA [Gordonia sp. ABSL1-1]|uniref:Sec-independent protein translocase subunit TatA n=1 Tax=Gordonia sp. ABSL1-1 TaxID=3053923 RepID=UPI002572EA3A|nr:Sec-independent protein translocase subunit TatA [Gordonia sp. ABSL1-1]MDL9935908.1 Sec-independent protein translocase subunit TatA [Gordonia sp. ABSL1-1]